MNIVHKRNMESKSKLDKMFDAGRQSGTVVPLDEIIKTVKKIDDMDLTLKENYKIDVLNKGNVPYSMVISANALVVAALLGLFIFNKPQKLTTGNKPSTVSTNEISSTPEPTDKSDNDKALLSNRSNHPVGSQGLGILPPATSSDSVKNKVSRPMPLKVSEAEGSNAKDVTFEEPKKINMNGIQVLELSRDELQKMGVRIENKMIEVPLKVAEGEYTLMGYSKYGTSFFIEDNNSNTGKKNNSRAQLSLSVIDSNLLNNILNIKQHRYYSEYPFPEPVLVTDDDGFYWRSYHVEEGLADPDSAVIANPQAQIMKHKVNEDRLIKRINTLIPILVRSGDSYTTEDKNNRRWKPDVILWYEANEALFHLLPTALASDIRHEYHEISENKTPVNTVGESKYFEGYKTKPGVFSDGLLYSNPVADKFTLSLQLAEERKINIGLYDINGRLIRNLLEEQTQAAGRQEYELNASELTAGIYLLVIHTSKSEQLSFRLIKK